VIWRPSEKKGGGKKKKEIYVKDEVGRRDEILKQQIWKGGRKRRSGRNAGRLLPAVRKGNEKKKRGGA